VTLASREVVGRELARVDGPEKVTGAARYGADVSVPGVLHAAVVRSPAPHARLLGIDAAAARAIPGVAHVLTADDLARVLAVRRFGPAIRDMPVLAEEVVRYEGEPVALVLAATPHAAREGAAAVALELDPLPVIETVEDALAPGATLLHGAAEGGEFAGAWTGGHDPTRNLAGQYHDRRGEPDAALAAAERVFTHEYRLAPLQHYALESPVATAVPSERELVVHTPNQYPFLMVRMLAGLLGRPESSIRVVVPYVGGSFGSKEYVNVVPLAAVAAVAVGRPVRLELTVEEAFRSSGRHGAIVRYTTGVTGGRIVARRIELLFDTGAYADQGPRVIRQAGYRSPGPYRIPNLQIDAYAVYTNKVPAGAYRGFGASQPIYGCECHMDEIAAALGEDPVAFRERHLLGLGEDFVTGDLPLDCDLPTALAQACERVPFTRGERMPDGRLTGTGVAVGVKNTASGRLPSRAIVRVHRDGSATVLAAGVELGQGVHTVLAQVAAETLGCELARVRVAAPDTALTPFDQRSSSSRLTVHLGVAVQRAAEAARDELLAAAAARTGADAASLTLRDGDVVGDGVRLSCDEIISGPASGMGGEAIGVGTVDQDDPVADTAFGQRAGYWEGSVGVARVAVDPGTGAIEVLDYVTVADAGRVINPHGAHGQELGGAVMAIGHALSEGLEFEDGYLANASPVDYRVPLATDAPRHFESLFLERGDGPGPFGAKGLGESSIITVAPAIANAVAAATGVRVRELPIRPWAILQAP
jgi:CO/xanthine dehydrogenase Mo-binding subunit